MQGINDGIAYILTLLSGLTRSMAGAAAVKRVTWNKVASQCSERRRLDVTRAGVGTRLFCRRAFSTPRAVAQKPLKLHTAFHQAQTKQTRGGHFLGATIVTLGSVP